jgi:hypothetical protein
VHVLNKPHAGIRFYLISFLFVPRSSHTKRHLPHCLIIGARKAGTRALLHFLNLHSQIQTSRKEIHFFDRSYELGLDWYRKQMPFAYRVCTALLHCGMAVE